MVNFFNAYRWLHGYLNKLKYMSGFININDVCFLRDGAVCRYQDGERQIQGLWCGAFRQPRDRREGLPYHERLPTQRTRDRRQDR